jgi:hypothetical protein
MWGFVHAPFTCCNSDIIIDVKILMHVPQISNTVQFQLWNNSDLCMDRFCERLQIRNVVFFVELFTSHNNIILLMRNKPQHAKVVAGGRQ